MKEFKSFNVADIVVQDLDNNIIPVDLAKPLGNLLYVSSSSLDWLQIAQSIHKGEGVDLSLSDLESISTLINSDSCKMGLICKVAIVKYIQSLIAI